ncbi:MAG: hypothetical protein BGP06_02915 [Rhizobiales bacterium 65-9]|nr:MAG: hypothetical protein BGP06_02915 [Rhizobiales bacterium 65-9]
MSSTTAPQTAIRRAAVLPPWRDRAGRLSPLKLVVFLALLLPGLWILLQWRLDWLGSKPITEALHQCGLWAARLLGVTLAVTPFRYIGNWPKLFLVRRMLGLGALAYAILHVSLYVVQEAYDVPHVLSEIVLRFYLTIGAIGVVGLIILGATSTDATIRRMGAAWHRLHLLIYPISALALLHFFIQTKINVYEAVLTTGLFVLLILYRLMRRFGLAYTPLSLLAAAAAGGALTMAIEALWYGLATGVPGLAVLKANLNFDIAIRPGWWVALAGAGVALLRLARPAPPSRQRG